MGILVEELSNLSMKNSLNLISTAQEKSCLKIRHNKNKGTISFSLSGMIQEAKSKEKTQFLNPKGDRGHIQEL